MATYNGAKYIRAQLDDLAAQTHLPAELVVCDDSSTDGTLDIIEQFATTAPFSVRIHRNAERLGYRANFIKCAGLCSSELIAFCDQDDRWHPCKLELLTKPFSDEHVLLVYHNARSVTANGRALPLLYRGGAKARSEPLCVYPWVNPLGFTQMFRRSLLRLEHLWPLSSDPNTEGDRLAHDQWYFLLASALGSIVYLPDVLADYRQHGGNTYGMSWYRALAPQLTELWHATHERNERLAAAEGRARIFRQASDTLTGDLRDRANEAAQWYDELAGLIRSRAELYDGTGLADRTSKLRDLIRAGAYGSNTKEFSRLSLAMDATIGVVGAFPLLERVTRRLARR
jgi:hypothetical protein